ncbi:MAG: DUF4386 domain-containing protein [Acidobacteria bacterium]|nr:DUF4386 domain-containing protein [Acidobacteriota bacterium]
MTMGVDDVARRAARLAGLGYLLTNLTVIGVTYGVLVPLIGGAPPAQAARNILAHPAQLRVGIVGNLAYCLEVVALAVALYVALRAVDPLLALLATVGRLFQGVTWLLISLNLCTAQRLLTRPEYADLLPPDQLPALVRLHLSGYDQYYVGLLFWTLASAIMAWLWLRSRLVPRTLAAFGVLASVWGAGCTLALLLEPTFATIVNLNLFDVPMVLYEMVLGAVLLFRGVQPADRYPKGATQ